MVCILRTSFNNKFKVMDVLKSYTDILFMIGAFLNASLFVPQILLLYKTKKVKGLSLPMFLGFNMIQFATALHGYMIKDHILMWGYALSFLTCGCVVILIISYRKN
jgi:uncharacterized protein with PQ loop repeat